MKSSDLLQNKTKLLLGKPVADQIISKIKKEFKIFKNNQTGSYCSSWSVPTLSIVQVGDRHDSSLFIGEKLKICAQLGFNAHLYHFSEESSVSSVIS